MTAEKTKEGAARFCATPLVVDRRLEAYFFLAPVMPQ